MRQTNIGRSTVDRRNKQESEISSGDRYTNIKRQERQKKMIMRN